MAKEILLLGWPRSGKTLFKVALTYIVDHENLGYAEPLPKQYGYAVDEALAGRGADLEPTLEPRVTRMKLKGYHDIDFIEYPLTRKDFDEYDDDRADELNSFHGILFFIKPEFRAREGYSLGRQKGKLGKTIGGKASVSIQLGYFGRLIVDTLSRFKLWRKLKIVGFLMTKTLPHQFNHDYFMQCVESETPRLLDVLKKRKVKMIFCPMDLVYPSKGIHRRGPREILNAILSTF